MQPGLIDLGETTVLCDPGHQPTAAMRHAIGAHLETPAEGQR